MKPTWWCEKDNDGGPVVCMTCEIPGHGEWRSQYALRLRPSYTLSVFTAVQILNHELRFMFGTELTQPKPAGLMSGEK